MQCCESCHLSCCLHMSAMIFLFCFCFVFVLLLLCFLFLLRFSKENCFCCSVFVFIEVFKLLCRCFYGFSNYCSSLFLILLQTLLFCFCFLLFLLMKQKTHPSILFASDSFTQSSFLCRPTFCSKMSILQNGICSNCLILEHLQYIWMWFFEHICLRHS